MTLKKLTLNIFRFFLYFFAIIGFLFTSVFIAMRLHLTDVKGSIDSRNSFYRAVKDTTSRITLAQSDKKDIKESEWAGSSEWVSLKDGIVKDNDLIQRVISNPKYQELKAKRSSFGWKLTWAMMIVYYGFIGLIAFDKSFLAQKMGNGVTTIGIPIGFGVIVFTVIITAIYVRRANSEYDDLTAEITKAVLK